MLRISVQRNRPVGNEWQNRRSLFGRSLYNVCYILIPLSFTKEKNKNVLIRTWVIRIYELQWFLTDTRKFRDNSVSRCMRVIRDDEYVVLVRFLSFLVFHTRKCKTWWMFKFFLHGMCLQRVIRFSRLRSETAFASRFGDAARFISRVREGSQLPLVYRIYSREKRYSLGKYISSLWLGNHESWMIHVSSSARRTRRRSWNTWDPWGWGKISVAISRFVGRSAFAGIWENRLTDVTRGNLARSRTFALVTPSRCSWSSFDVPRAWCQEPWAPGRWRAPPPPASSHPPVRSSPRIATSWWRPATRWQKSIALDPPRPAPVEWCPCRE